MSYLHLQVVFNLTDMTDCLKWACVYICTIRIYLHICIKIYTYMHVHIHILYIYIYMYMLIIALAALHHRHSGNFVVFEAVWGKQLNKPLGMYGWLGFSVRMRSRQTDTNR